MQRRLEILFVGSSDLVCLPLVRALGRAGHRVCLLRTSGGSSRTAMSRFCAASFAVDIARLGMRAASTQLAETIGRQRFDAVMPADDIAAELIERAYWSGADTPRLIGPTASTRILASDFIAVLPLAVDAGLTAPTYERLRQGEAAPELPMPSVVLPVRPTVVIDDEPQSFSRRVVRTADELDDKLRDDLLRTDIVVMPLIDGRRLSLDLCAFDGRVLGAATSALLHLPRRGGPGSYFRVGPMRPDHLEIVTSLARNLAWTGFMSIDCVERHGDLVFTSASTSPTLSAVLARRGGVDMAKLLAAAVDGALDAPIAMPHADLFVRALEPDLRWAMSDAIRARGVRALAAWVGSFGRVAVGRERPGLDWLTDPGPAIGLTRDLAQKVRRRTSVREGQSTKPRQGSLGASADLSFDSSLLLVCQGNINRSFVAEQLLKARGFAHVQSAGLLPVSGRRPSRHAEAFVRERLGTDVETFRSTSIDRRLRENAEPQLVVCFERWQADAIAGRYPMLRDKIVLLAEIGGEASHAADIEDPHGRRAEAYRACFERIERLVGAIKPGHGTGN